MKIHFLGDSITYGESLDSDEAWTAIVQSVRPNDTITNRGISGDTTAGMLARFQTDIITDKPDFVHIMGGLNDIICGATASQIQANIKAMAHQAKFHNIHPIIGICPLPVMELIIPEWKEFTDFDRLMNEMGIFNDWLRKFVAVATNVSIIDYELELTYQYPKNRKEIYLDGIHLNKKGNEVLAKIMLNFLEKQIA